MIARKIHFLEEKMKKLVGVLLVLVLAVSMLVSCAKKVDIGIAMPETHVERWVKDGNSLKAEAEKLGYTAAVQWANADQPTQNQQIEGFLTQGARALIIGNINDGVGAAVASAKRENAVVIAYDRIIQGTDEYEYYITFNNYKVGTLQGQSIVAGLDLDSATTTAPKIITLFAGSPTDANANFFFQGAMDVLIPYIDRGVLRVVGPFPRHFSEPAFQQIATENWQAPIAKARMEALLIGDARNVILDAILAPNDTLARAIIEACKADEKYQTRLPVVTGQDAEFDSAVSIMNGEQFSTVFKDTAKLAEAAILLAHQLLNGEAVNVPGTVLADGDLAEIGFTGTGYVRTLLLDPILVTRENLLVPVEAGFYSEAQAAQLRQ
jgi:putative multiple sugar transport system substrate-binding protein